MGEIDIRINGLPTVLAALDDVVLRLTSLESKVSNLTEAVDRLEARIGVDFDARTAERDAARADAARLQAIVDEMAALDVTQLAEIQALKDEAATIVARLDALDPIPEPPAPTPVEEPPVV